MIAATLAGLANGVHDRRPAAGAVHRDARHDGHLPRRRQRHRAARRTFIRPHTWLNDIHDPTVVPFLDWLSGKAGAKPNRRGLAGWCCRLSIWILIVASIGAAILLRYTRLGRHIFAIGSNEETARLCGVTVERTKILVYMLAGFFGGLAAIMLYSDIGGIGQPTTGDCLRVVRDRGGRDRRRQLARRRRLGPGQLDRGADYHDPVHGRETDRLGASGGRKS